MRRAIRSRVPLLLLVAFLSHLPTVANACTACMGDANSKVGPAMNAAIFVMLGCIGFMLSSLAGFGIYLMKRASAPIPPHADIAQMPNIPEEDT